MAAPVGHIICALALLNSGTVKISDQSAYFAGTSFPDIRYISDVKRAVTHQLKDDTMAYVKQAGSDFELGRRLHVFVDHEREKHMREHDAYRFVANGPYSTHMLKMVEDNILFDRLKGKFNEAEVFKRILPEEKAYGLSDQSLLAWHQILQSYLDSKSWFAFTRYFNAASVYKQFFGVPDKFFKDLWTSAKSLGFLLYAYFQIERLSRNEQLRAIILDFYDNKMPKTLSTAPPT